MATKIRRDRVGDREWYRAIGIENGRAVERKGRRGCGGFLPQRRSARGQGDRGGGRRARRQQFATGQHWPASQLYLRRRASPRVILPLSLALHAAASPRLTESPIHRVSQDTSAATT